MKTRCHVLLINLFSILVTSELSFPEELRANVEFPDFSLVEKSSCDLPYVVRVTLYVENEEPIYLTLKRNDAIGGNVYLPRKAADGSITFKRFDPYLVQDEAMYQDDTFKAELDLLCAMSLTSIPDYTLEGSLFLPNEKMYSLKRIDDRYILVEERDDDGDDNIMDLDPSLDQLPLSDPEDIRTKREIPEDVYLDCIALIHYVIYESWYNRAPPGTDTVRKTQTLQGLRRHFAHLFNSVNQRYKTASPRIIIRLIGYIIEDETQGDWFLQANATTAENGYLDGSAILNATWYYSRTPGFPENDHVAAFTSEDVFALRNNTWRDIPGIAYESQMCSSPGSRSISVTEYREEFVPIVRIIAHELAHSLGAIHDGEPGNNCSSDDNFIMSTKKRLYDVTNANFYYFSSCTAAEIQTYVNTKLAGSDFSRECMQTIIQANESVPDVSDEVLGQAEAGDAQCRRIQGPDSYVCRGVTATDIKYCRRLYCLNTSSGTCPGYNANPGTTCGNKEWCQLGHCVYNESAPKANPDCLYGDRPGIVDTSGNRTCAEVITSETSHLCNNTGNRKLCCDTCNKVVCGKECQNGGFLNSTTCECECEAPYSGNLCGKTHKRPHYGSSADR